MSYQEKKRKYQEKFEHLVLCTNWKGAPADSKLTVPLYARQTGIYGLPIIEQVGAHRQDQRYTQKKEINKKFSIKSTRKTAHYCWVTIYPNTRDRLLQQLSELASHPLFNVAENVMYFTLKSMGIPPNLCSGWICVDMQDERNMFEYDQLCAQSIEAYLESDEVGQYNFSKHVSEYKRAYSHYVKPNKDHCDDNKKDAESNCKQSNEPESDEEHNEATNRATRKRKLVAEDNDDANENTSNDNRPPMKRRRRAHGRRCRTSTTSNIV